MQIRAGRIYRYEPVGLDAWSSGYRPNLEPGTQVRVIKPSASLGSKKTVNCGHVYVEHPDTHKFVGLVLVGSLQPVNRQVRKVDQDKETFRNLLRMV